MMLCTCACYECLEMICHLQLASYLLGLLYSKKHCGATVHVLYDEYRNPAILLNCL